MYQSLTNQIASTFFRDVQVNQSQIYDYREIIWGQNFMVTFSKLNELNSVSKLGFMLFSKYSIAHLEMPRLKYTRE